MLQKRQCHCQLIGAKTSTLNRANHLSCLALACDMLHAAHTHLFTQQTLLPPFKLSSMSSCNIL